MEMGPSRPPVDASLETFLPEGSWVSPIADDRVLPLEADPATLAEERESIRLAFIAALQHLPARQRAVLVLCEVLRWQASEVADLLDTSVPAVNSALQRARATLATLDTGPRQPVMDAGQRELLARYVDAFERFDVDELVGLLHKDAVQSMPPYAMWLLGSEDIGRFMLGPGHGCLGSKLVPVHANGSPAFGHYKPGPEGGYVPWAIVVLGISRGPDLRDPFLPRGGQALPPVRAAARTDACRPVSSSSSASVRDTFSRRTRSPRRRQASCSRANVLTVPRSGDPSATSQAMSRLPSALKMTTRARRSLRPASGEFGGSVRPNVGRGCSSGRRPVETGAGVCLSSGRLTVTSALVRSGRHL